MTELDMRMKTLYPFFFFSSWLYLPQSIWLLRNRVLFFVCLIKYTQYNLHVAVYLIICIKIYLSASKFDYSRIARRTRCLLCRTKIIADWHIEHSLVLLLYKNSSLFNSLTLIYLNRSWNKQMSVWWTFQMKWSAIFIRRC